ncbi:MAG TPA: hypothetical protein VJP80_03700 [Candidatus Saccharimonadales bacterium]|nr:hypothetical protein [Candidatus Saccharimonadales bacterium]
MLNRESENLLRQIVHAQSGHFTNRVNQEIVTISSEMAQRGVTRSSMHIFALQQACVRELEQRSAFVWENLVRILRTLRVEWYAELSVDLKREMHIHIVEAANNLTVILSQRSIASQQLGLKGTETTIDAQGVVAIFNAEIDLFVAGMQREHSKVELSPASVTNQYIFNAAVTSVQTGHDAIANIQINPAGREDLIKVLHEIHSALQQSGILSDANKKDSLEVVADCMANVKKQEPNKRRLLSSLKAVAETTAFLANSVTLLTALRIAAATFGVPIP